MTSCLCQQRTFAPLDIAETDYRRIVATHGVMSGFGELVSCFRKTTSRTEDAFCGPFIQQESTQSIGRTPGVRIWWPLIILLEVAYMFKYPERNGRTDGADPWSLRQMAVYQQHNRYTGQDTWIVLMCRHRSLVWDRLVHLLRPGVPTISSTLTSPRLHEELLTCHISDWRPYMLHYEETVSQTVGVIVRVAMCSGGPDN